MERTCLECGDKLFGRADKKFCNDTCRNHYHNTLNRDSYTLIRNTHNRLRKNYRILEHLNPTGRAKVRKKTLIDFGFTFNLFTELFTCQSGNTYHYVYDHRYSALENDFYLLEKRAVDELFPAISLKP